MLCLSKDRDYVVLLAITEKAWSNGRLVEIAQAALNDTLDLTMFDKKFIKKYLEVNNESCN